MEPNLIRILREIQAAGMAQAAPAPVAVLDDITPMCPVRNRHKRTPRKVDSWIELVSRDNINFGDNYEVTLLNCFI